jgi:hypothetical protein
MRKRCAMMRHDAHKFEGESRCFRDQEVEAFSSIQANSQSVIASTVAECGSRVCVIAA